jgi:hypothetical protein
MRAQIGAFFPTRDMPADHAAIRDWAQAAEAIGFDFIEVSDHVLGADRAALPHFTGPYDVNDAFHETLHSTRRARALARLGNKSRRCSNSATPYSENLRVAMPPMASMSNYGNSERRG